MLNFPMKAIPLYLYVTTLLLLPVMAQEPRIRTNITANRPSDHWVELEPVEMEIQEKKEPRVAPTSIPSWQTRYTLGPGDTLDFSVFDRPDLTRLDVPVAPDGTISYLQAIAVHANGLTLDQLRSRIEADLKKYQKNVKVSVSPTKILSKDFSIIGRVNKPGRFTLDRPTSILEGIAMAQGIQVGSVGNSAYELADFDRSFVARGGKKLSVDLARLYFEGDFSQNAYLEPDDYIYVASNVDNEVYVLGAVNNPGRRKMPMKLTITKAIAEAGGFVDGAYRMRVLHIKGSIHKPVASIVDMKAILEGRAKDFEIDDRDIVYVNYHPFHLVDQALENALTSYVQTVSAQTLNQNYQPILLGN